MTVGAIPSPAYNVCEVQSEDRQECCHPRYQANCWLRQTARCADSRSGPAQSRYAALRRAAGFRMPVRHFGIVTVGHAHDDFIKPQTPRDFHDTIRANLLAEGCDVFKDRSLEHHPMLRQIGNLAADRFRCIFIWITTIEPDRTAIRA